MCHPRAPGNGTASPSQLCSTCLIPFYDNHCHSTLRLNRPRFPPFPSSCLRLSLSRRFCRHKSASIQDTHPDHPLTPCPAPSWLSATGASSAISRTSRPRTQQKRLARALLLSAFDAPCTLLRYHSIARLSRHRSTVPAERLARTAFRSASPTLKAIGRTRPSNWL